MKWLWLWVLVAVAGGVHGGQVTYDGRSLIINGNRSILFSGSIHYPRSTPQMWPSLIAKAKQGGIDVIDTYIFWNAHEPHPGQYNFKGRYNLVKFLQEIEAQGLYVSLRIGPFIESEWSYGGLPFWLRDVPGIIFRSDNEPFKFQMKRFVAKVVNLLKAHKMYASQGGPIVLSQIENEYQNVEAAFHDKGPPYVEWAAKMAVGLQTGVPWVMCKQKDAPDPVINSCNGLNCGETFEGPNSPNKPSLWTENWTQRYEVFGEDAQGRSPEEIAFAVALFIAKKGSFVNYYMFHGGTNFGRWGSEYVKTSYYDQAPLDEYGMIRQPKWGHLKELHAAIKLCSAKLLSGKPSEILLGKEQVAYVFQRTSGQCAALLTNNDFRNNVEVTFRQTSYQLPPRSISILPNCRNAVFNTAKVSAQYSTRSSRSSQKFNLVGKWKVFKEVIPNLGSTSLASASLLEQMSTTRDTTDYLWYTFSYMHKPNVAAQLILHVESRAHVLHAFVNGELAGTGHGSHGIQEFVFRKSISVKNGENNISLLSVMVGLPDSGAYMERKISGLRKVRIESTTHARDFTMYQWGYQVGFHGEKMRIYKLKGSRNVTWSSGLGSMQRPLVWYKINFVTPEGNDPVALNLGSMSKGEAWVNGNSIGRYWVSFHTAQGVPSQTHYHVPRSFLKPSGNLLVIFEEIGGDPSQVSLESISITKVCGHVSDLHPQLVVLNGQLKEGADLPHVQLQCPSGKTISAVEFASFGTPTGSCGNYTIGECHSAYTREVVQKACLGKESCSIRLSSNTFGVDPCPGTSKALLVDANCS